MMNQVVVITGASTGIGFDAAKALAHKGFSVIAGARRDSDLARLQALSKNITAVRLDVTDSQSIQTAIESVSKKLDSANVVHLINNAGIAVAGPIEAVPMSEFRKQFDVNVFGLLEVTQAVLPWIRKTQGRILNISSVAGLSAAPFLGPYAASKFAVEALSDSLRREVQAFGVKVILVEPGPIDTPIWDKGLAPGQDVKPNLKPEILPLYQKALEKFQGYVAKIVLNALPVSAVSNVLVQQLTKAEPEVRVLVVSPKEAVLTKLQLLMPAKWVDKAIAERLQGKH